MADFPGTPGDDDFTGTSGAETMTGEGGNGQLRGKGGNDTIDVSASDFVVLNVERRGNQSVCRLE